ncbi:MAG: (2Fe-2S)-binding protein [Rhodospirillales bacterium]
MILCLCSTISDRQVRQAAAAGVTAWQEVFRREQASPNCGACVDMICEILDEECAAGAGAPACARCA